MGGSPTVNSLFAQRVVVGVGDMAVANSPGVILSTYALGSCVGVAVLDPEIPVGGLLHVMLPDSQLSPEKASRQPSMFADTGMRNFLAAVHGFKGEKRRLKVFLAGGASVLTQSDMFKIGERNIAAIKALVGEHRLSVVGEELGGLNNRTVHLNINSGTVEIKTATGIQKVQLA